MRDGSAIDPESWPGFRHGCPRTWDERQTEGKAECHQEVEEHNFVVSSRGVVISLLRDNFNERIVIS
jgi:hypothetical protein